MNKVVLICATAIGLAGCNATVYPSRPLVYEGAPRVVVREERAPRVVVRPEPVVRCKMVPRQDLYNKTYYMERICEY